MRWVSRGWRVFFVGHAGKCNTISSSASFCVNRLGLKTKTRLLYIVVFTKTVFTKEGRRNLENVNESEAAFLTCCIRTNVTPREFGELSVFPCSRRAGMQRTTLSQLLKPPISREDRNTGNERAFASIMGDLDLSKNKEVQHYRQAGVHHIIASILRSMSGKPISPEISHGTSQEPRHGVVALSDHHRPWSQSFLKTPGPPCDIPPPCPAQRLYWDAGR